MFRKNAQNFSQQCLGLRRDLVPGGFLRHSAQRAQASFVLPVDKRMTLLYNHYNRYKEKNTMELFIDFNSDEAFYVQLCNQIILGIATSKYHEGDSLPSVRQLADMVGINMHTVNKAYSILRQEGYLKLDRRRGAIVAIEADRMRDIEEIRFQMRSTVAKALCRDLQAEYRLRTVNRQTRAAVCTSAK